MSLSLISVSDMLVLGMVFRVQVFSSGDPGQLGGIQKERGTCRSGSGNMLCHLPVCDLSQITSVSGTNLK